MTNMTPELEATELLQGIHSILTTNATFTLTARGSQQLIHLIRGLEELIAGLSKGGLAIYEQDTRSDYGFGDEERPDEEPVPF